MTIVWTVENGKPHGKTPCGKTLMIKRYDSAFGSGTLIVSHTLKILSDDGWQHLDYFKRSCALEAPSKPSCDYVDTEADREAITAAKAHADYLFLD